MSDYPRQRTMHGFHGYVWNAWEIRVRTSLEKELVTEKKSGGEVAPKWRVPNGG